LQGGATVKAFTEAIPEGEFRETFSVAAIGTTPIFENPLTGRKIEIVEVAVFTVAANTFQLVIGSKPVSAVYDFLARQPYVDAGFLMEQGEILSITTGGAGQIVGHVRWRPQTVLE
jgi:hypothetical protein